MSRPWLHPRHHERAVVGGVLVFGASAWMRVSHLASSQIADLEARAVFESLECCVAVIGLYERCIAVCDDLIRRELDDKLSAVDMLGFIEDAPVVVEVIDHHARHVQRGWAFRELDELIWNAREFLWTDEHLAVEALTRLDHGLEALRGPLTMGEMTWDSTIKKF